MAITTPDNSAEVNIRPTGITINTEEVKEAIKNQGIIAYEYVQNVFDYQPREKGPARIYFVMKDGSTVNIVDVPTTTEFSPANVTSIVLENDIGKSGLHPDNLVNLESNQVEEDYTLGQHGRGGKIAAAAILGLGLAKGIRYSSYHPDLGKWSGRFEMSKYGSDARTETLNLIYQKEPNEVSATTTIEIFEPSSEIVASFVNLTTNFLPLNPVYENSSFIGKVRKALNLFTLKFKEDRHIRGALNEKAGIDFDIPMKGTYTVSPRIEILPEQIELKSEVEYFSKIKIYTEAFVDGLRVRLFSGDKSILPWSFYGLGRANYKYSVKRSSDSTLLLGSPEHAVREALQTCDNPLIFQKIITSLIKANSSFKCVETTAISSIMDTGRELTPEAQAAFAEGWKLYLTSRGLPEATLISFSKLANDIATDLGKNVVEISNPTFGDFLSKYGGTVSADNLYKDQVDETTRKEQERFQELERKALKPQTDENIYLIKPTDFSNYLRSLENILKLCADTKGGYQEREGRHHIVLLETKPETNYNRYQYLPKDLTFLAENICALSPNFRVTISVNQEENEAVKYLISSEENSSNPGEVKISIQKAITERVDNGFILFELDSTSDPVDLDTQIKVTNLLISSFKTIQNKEGFVDRKKWYDSRDPADPRLPGSVIEKYAKLMKENEDLKKKVTKIDKEKKSKEAKEDTPTQELQFNEGPTLDFQDILRIAKYPLAAVIAAGMLYFPVSKLINSLDIIGNLNILPPIPGLNIQRKQENTSNSWGAFTAQTYSDYPGPNLERQQQQLDTQKTITNEVTITVNPELQTNEITSQQNEVLRSMEKAWVLEVYGNADGNGYYAEYVSNELSGDWKINYNVESVLNLPDRIDAKDKVVISKRFKLNPVLTNQFKIPIKNNTRIAALDVSSEFGAFEGYKAELLTDGTVLVTVPANLTSEVGYIDVRATLISDPKGQLKPFASFKTKIDPGKLSPAVTNIISKAINISNTQGIDYYVALAQVAQSSTSYSFKPNYAATLPMSDSPEDSLNKFYASRLATCGIANRELMYLSSYTPEGVTPRKFNFVLGWLIGVANNPASVVDTGMLSGDSYHGYTIMEDTKTSEVKIDDATPYKLDTETEAFFKEKSDYEKSQIVKKVYAEDSQKIKKNSVQAVDYWRYLKEAAINLALVATTILVTKMLGRKPKRLEDE
ncbi:MAG: hypothetical protein WCO33_04065 [bacterium]